MCPCVLYLRCSPPRFEFYPNRLLVLFKSWELISGCTKSFSLIVVWSIKSLEDIQWQAGATQNPSLLPHWKLLRLQIWRKNNWVWKGKSSFTTQYKLPLESSVKWILLPREAVHLLALIGNSKVTFPSEVNWHKPCYSGTEFPLLCANWTQMWIAGRRPDFPSILASHLWKAIQ